VSFESELSGCVSKGHEAEHAVNYQLVQCKMQEDDNAMVYSEYAVNQNKLTQDLKWLLTERSLTVSKH
jgi:hypothetical protein